MHPGQVILYITLLLSSFLTGGFKLGSVVFSFLKATIGCIGAPKLFFIHSILMLQYILRSTLLTRINLQYYWDKYPRGAKGCVYPRGININKRKKNYLTLNYTTKNSTNGGVNSLSLFTQMIKG